MALLVRATLVAMLVAAPIARANGAGLYDLMYYAERVSCRDDLAFCFSADGSQRRDGSHQRGTALISRSGSRHPQGLFLYLELDLSGERRGVLELDLPFGASTVAPLARYREFSADALLFDATKVIGTVEIDPNGCPCGDGRIELELSDLGEDGIANTDDDQYRRISRGRFSASKTFCRNPRVLPFGDQLAAQRTGVCQALPRVQQPPSEPSTYDPYGDPYVDPTVYGEAHVGCGAESPPPDADQDEGCGGDEPDYDSDSGCDGDAEPASDGSAGCDGDTNSGDCSDADGCSSDSGASCADDGCAGDATIGPSGTVVLRTDIVTMALFLLFHLRPRRRSATRGGKVRTKSCDGLQADPSDTR